MIHITVNIASTSFNTVYNMLVSTIWMKLALIRVCQKINKANPIPMGSNFPDVHRCSSCIDGHSEVHTVFGQAHIRRLSCQESARTCRWYQVAVVTWHLLQKKNHPLQSKIMYFSFGYCNDMSISLYSYYPILVGSLPAWHLFWGGGGVSLQ